MTTEEIKLASELLEFVELLHAAQQRLLDIAGSLLEGRRSHEKRQENP